jgi:SAM-dependent methyltransferase
MKFANYKFYAKGVNNLGDNMQIISIDSIYKAMGISEREIIYIDKNELNTYKGEYVILPVTMPLVDYMEGGISGRFSDHIVPVFLGLTLVTDSLLLQEVDYYRKFEPIGCRDERAMNILRKYGIQAYLHGCITATLPKRSIEKDKTFDKVFIVDVAKNVLSYIPDELMKDAVFLTHMHEEIDNPKELMQEYYNRYKNEAKLVITGLLHCSVPCMAAGIPVVVAKNNISYRYGWLEKLIHLYDKNDFANIDWNPVPIEYEDHKKRLLEVTINRLLEAFNKYSSIYELSWFYEQRKKKEYILDAFEPIKRYIDSHFIDKNKEYKYAIWGVTQISSVSVNYIMKEYPKAKLMHVYDTYRKVLFEGLYSEGSENICNHPDEIVLVTTNGASRMAQKLFDEIGKDKESYVLWKPIS